MSERPPAPEPLPHPVVDNHCHLEMTLDGTEKLAPRKARKVAPPNRKVKARAAAAEVA